MWNATKCNLCGDCLTRCLYVDYDKERAVTEIKLLMEGKPADILSKCITCCACREYCPKDADPYDLILKLQEKYQSFPIKPEALAAFNRMFEVPSQVIPGDPGKPALSLCVMERNLPEGAIDSRMFRGMTIVKGADYFCYIGYVHVGKETPIAQNAQKFIDKMSSLNQEIIFLHDDCYAMVSAKVKDYGISVPFKYMHILEYMRNYLRDHKNSIMKLNKKVAYQRPCASRFTPEKDVLVDEIFELVGVERTKRKYEREFALCCTGSIIQVFPQLAVEIQAKNVDDAINSGADALITLCPLCDRVLKRPTIAKGLNKIYITDLCRMALGEKAFPA